MVNDGTVGEAMVSSHDWLSTVIMQLTEAVCESGLDTGLAI